jgi:competence protein ComEC
MARRYPAVWLLASITIGIVLADRLPLPAWSFLLIGVGFAIAGLLAVRESSTAAGLLAAALFLSGFNFALHYRPDSSIAVTGLLQQPTVCTVYGRVADWPLLKQDRIEFRIAVDSIESDYRRFARGALLLKVTDTATALQRGDRIIFRTRVYPVSTMPAGGTFNYRRYLEHKGVQAVAYMPTLLNVQISRREELGLIPVADRIRKFVGNSLESNLTADAAALARGFLLGDTRNIPPDVYRRFRDTGTLHVMAVSGSNVALVLAFFHLLLRPFRIRRSIRLSVLLAVIPIYALMCYLEPSVVRASILAALVLLGKLTGRKIELNNLMAVTATIILLTDPAQLFDIGFQLSFVTAWGLVFAVPRLTRLFEGCHRRRWYRWLVFPLIVALIAQLFSTPLIAYHFGRIALWSVPANLLVVPLVSAATLAVLVIPIAHAVLPILGMLVGSLINPLIELTVQTLNLFGADSILTLSAGSSSLPGAGFCFWVYVCLVLAAPALQLKRCRRRLIGVLSLTALAILAMASVRVSTTQPGRFSVHSVPGGVMTIIQPTDLHIRQSRADLIVTHLAGRRYSLDDRVIGPVLAEGGVNRLGNLIVLSADYQSLDDLLRLSAAFDAENIVFAGDLRQAVRDHQAHDTSGVFAELDIRFAGPASGDSHDRGYALERLGLRLKTGVEDVLIPLSADDLLAARIAAARPTTVVLGSVWMPSPGDWEQLADCGFGTIVAPSVRAAQEAPSAENGAESDVTQVSIPDYVHDLRRDCPLIRRFL